MTITHYLALAAIIFIGGVITGATLVLAWCDSQRICEERDERKHQPRYHNNL